MKLRVTPELSMLLKTLRVQSNISSKDLAAHIDMSPSYVSKLEGGSVRFIQEKLLRSILCFICKSTDFYGEVLPNVYKLLKGIVSTADVINQDWFMQFDIIERQVAIPQGMGAALDELLDKASVTHEDLLAFINSNVDSDSNQSLPANRFVAIPYGDTSRLAMRVALSREDLEKVLVKADGSAPYNIAHAVVYGVMRLAYFGEDVDTKLPPTQAIEVLMRSASFMDAWGADSLVGMSQFLSSDEFVHRQLPLLGRQGDIIAALASRLEEAASYDSAAVNNQLYCFTQTMDWDPAFALYILGIPFFRLGEMGHTKKTQLLHDIEKLLECYDALSDYEKSLESY